ncbi:MAG: hypothetical protein AB7O65_14720 [Candidatus Korobacteraceae bacterium]
MKYKIWIMTILLATSAALAQSAQSMRTLPSGAEISVRTDTAIPAQPAANTKFTAKISRAVADTSGNVAIPQGADATLVAVTTDDGKDTVLDLESVTINGRTYLLTTQTSTESTGPGGLGANKRTGKYVGGGALIGGVLGALLGGGKGAAIGAILGGAGGAGAQVYTGKDKEIPAETVLNFKLAQNLELQPASASAKPGLQTR